MWAGAGVLAGMAIATALPVILASPDTFIDFASLTYSISTGNYAAARWDAISLMVPGVTGLGAFNRAGDALKTVNRLDNIADTTRLVNSLDNASDLKQILVVGENSFEYSTALRRALPQNYHITATSLDSLGTLQRMGQKWKFQVPKSSGGFDVLHHIDARRLEDYFAPGSFDAILFNNPHRAEKTPQGFIDQTLSDRATSNLINDFLNSAQQMIKSNGHIEINLAQSLLRVYPNIRELVNMRASIPIRYFYRSDFYAPYIPRYTWGGALSLAKCQSVQILDELCY